MLGKKVEIVASEKFEEDKFTFWLQYETGARGLGEPFEKAINACVEAIRKNPKIFPICTQNSSIRAGIVDRKSKRRKKFPFLIFY